MIKQAIIIRKDLKMSAGKIAAQTVHAVMRANNKPFIDYINTDPVCIAYEVKNEKQLDKVFDSCLFGDFEYAMQIDAGYTEVEPETNTCVYVVAEEEKLKEITKGLQLYKG